MCIRKPTPVTTSIISVESGSTRKLMSTLNEPLAIHLNTTTSIERSVPGRLMSLKKMDTAIRKDAPMAAEAMNPTAFLGMRLPKTPFIMAPRSGSRGINHTCSIITLS